jgi:hypothetical protein
MKLNLKSVLTLFTHGIKVDDGIPAAVVEISLHVVDNNDCAYKRVRAITRDVVLDLRPKELKRVVTNMRNEADRINPNRAEWLLEVQCCGGAYSRSVRIQ